MIFYPLLEDVVTVWKDVPSEHEERGSGKTGIRKNIDGDVVLVLMNKFKKKPIFFKDNAMKAVDFSALNWHNEIELYR